MNPYAFFTSGYTTASGTTLVSRNWKIVDIQLTLDLWFYDQAITAQIDQALAGEGLVLTSQNFTLGPQYNLTNTSQLQNTWILPGGVESANALFIWVLANDYLKYPYCRKHFRLSGNINSLQLKVGADYIPPYPITGHAGYCEMADNIDDDNTDFVVALHQAAGAFLDTDKVTRINKENFALNTRTYDPSVATNLEYQLSYFEEKRVQGRALYAIRLDNNPFETDVISGYNTKKISPLELVIKVDNAGHFARDSTMYTLYWHDFIVNYKNGGVDTYGQK